jgi:predicted transcriptional regulator
MDYQKFKRDYLASGKTQKAYGEELSISSSMVHYYLRKAREESDPRDDSALFSELTVQEVDGREIKIVTPSGMQIVIPI